MDMRDLRCACYTAQTSSSSSSSEEEESGNESASLLTASQVALRELSVDHVAPDLPAQPVPEALVNYNLDGTEHALLRDRLLRCPVWALRGLLCDVEAANPGILATTLEQARQATVEQHNLTLLNEKAHRADSVAQVGSRLTSIDMVLHEDPIVQFSSPMYYVGEHEHEMIIEVMRFEPLEKESVVKFTTANSTAVAGKHFDATSGTLVFKPGEQHKKIQISLLESDEWDTSLEFHVELMSKGSVNCQIGRYLKDTRVKIIDKHVFPTDRYAEEVQSGEIASVHSMVLLLEYIKMNFNKDNIHAGTLKYIALGLYDNVQYFVTMYTKVYLIDYILEPENHKHLIVFDEAHLWLVLVVLMKLLFFMSNHVLNYQSCSWGVGGGSSKLLRTSLMRRYAMSTADARSGLKSADLIVAMSRDVGKLVQEGYYNVIGLFQVLGKVAMVALYQVTFPIVFNKPARPIAFLGFVLLPIFIGIFLYFREAKTRRLVRERQKRENRFFFFIDETVDTFDLITDYTRRDRCADECEKTVTDMNKATTASNQANCNNEYAVEWFAQVVIAIFSVIGGMLVINGNMGVGAYLVNITIFEDMGKAWLKVYLVVSDMIACGPAVRSLIHLLTLPTDLSSRMELNRSRRSRATEGARPMRGGRYSTFDLAPIEVKDIALEEEGLAPHLRTMGTLRVEQGTFVAILGPHNCGKAALLRLLGGEILPDAKSLEDNGGPSRFSIPSHLRVIHISPQPMFFHGSLEKNLTFGVRHGDPDGRLERVEAVCKVLNLPDHIRGFLKNNKKVSGTESCGTVQEEENTEWLDWSSTSEKALLNLARALISNPEMLCIHKPTNHLDEATSLSVMKVLRTYVEQKGVEHDSATWHLRRPRTCITTSIDISATTLADKVWLLSKSTGIHELSRDQIKRLEDDPTSLTEQRVGFHFFG